MKVHVSACISSLAQLAKTCNGSDKLVVGQWPMSAREPSHYTYVCSGFPWSIIHLNRNAAERISTVPAQVDAQSVFRW